LLVVRRKRPIHLAGISLRLLLLSASLLLVGLLTSVSLVVAAAPGPVAAALATRTGVASLQVVDDVIDVITKSRHRGGQIVDPGQDAANIARTAESTLALVILLLLLLAMTTILVVGLHWLLIELLLLRHPLPGWQLIQK
jgi:hypothetical protein